MRMWCDKLKIVAFFSFTLHKWPLVCLYVNFAPVKLMCRRDHWSMSSLATEAMRVRQPPRRATSSATGGTCSVGREGHARIRLGVWGKKIQGREDKEEGYYSYFPLLSTVQIYRPVFQRYFSGTFQRKNTAFLSQTKFQRTNRAYIAKRISKQF